MSSLPLISYFGILLVTDNLLQFCIYVFRSPFFSLFPAFLFLPLFSWKQSMLAPALITIRDEFGFSLIEMRKVDASRRRKIGFHFFFLEGNQKKGCLFWSFWKWTNLFCFFPKQIGLIEFRKLGNEGKNVLLLFPLWRGGKNQDFFFWKFFNSIPIILRILLALFWSFYSFWKIFSASLISPDFKASLWLLELNLRFSDFPLFILYLLEKYND